MFYGQDKRFCECGRSTADLNRLLIKLRGHSNILCCAKNKTEDKTTPRNKLI